MGLLVVRRGNDEGARFPLEKAETTVGRHPDSDVFLDDITVSRKHAVFVTEDQVTRVRDAGSLNGTYVNRVRIDEAVLASGDEVQVGKFKLVYLRGSGRVSARSYLSIGDVLTLLRQEFPDVTISKIRFLESQGLVNPERTPSGYRKFYEHDVERLRWVLRQQREHFLPLKVIKDRLEEESGPAVVTAKGPRRATAPAAGSVAEPAVAAAVATPVGVRPRRRRGARGGARPRAGTGRSPGVVDVGRVRPPSRRRDPSRAAAPPAPNAPIGRVSRPSTAHAGGRSRAVARATAPPGRRPTPRRRARRRRRRRRDAGAGDPGRSGCHAGGPRHQVLHRGRRGPRRRSPRSNRRRPPSRPRSG